MDRRKKEFMETIQRERRRKRKRRGRIGQWRPKKINGRPLQEEFGVGGSKSGDFSRKVAKSGDFF